MYNLGRIAAVTLAFSMLLIGTPASAVMPSVQLFQSAAASPAAAAVSRNALRGKGRAVRVDRRVLRRGRLQLNLGVGPNLDMVRTRLAERGDGARTWVGRVKGDPDSEAILVSRGRAVVGSIRHQGRLYKLRQLRGGVQQLEEVDPGDPMPSKEMEPDLPGTAAAVADMAFADVAFADVAAMAVGETSIIDVLVAYTPEARDSYGGSDGIQALIDLAVEETNQAYLNSNAPIQLRLAGTVETDYHDSGDMNADLTRITTPGDGVMDDVLALRDDLGADVVSLLVGSGSYCGLSWQMGALSSAYADYAFNVVHTSCATGYYSFGHEIGHNLGLSHDHANARSGLFAYSFGWQDPGSLFRTVMAYNCTLGCVRVQHFSNPEVDYAGAPTGQDGWADNALALAETAPLVATWRVGAAPQVPLAPSDLVAQAVGHDRIDLSWHDEAGNETGFQVERSADGQDYQLIATLPENSVAYSDQPLDPETSWFYRVRAVNGAGGSPPSNEAWATTAPAPVSVPQAPSGLTATALSHSEIALSWTDQATDETGFELERSLDDGQSWALLVSLGADVTEYTDQALEAETAYGYRVRAVNDAGASGYGNSVGATTPAEPVYPPTAPSGLSAQGLSTSAIAVSWSDHADNETRYELERSTDGGMNWSLAAELDTDTMSHTDTGLTAATYYLYRVRAVGAGGASGYSNQAGASTEAEPAACAASGAEGLRLRSRATGWTLTNTGSTDLTLSGIEIGWPAGQGKLRKIRLGGDEIWRGAMNPATAVIDSGWNRYASRRLLEAGASQELKFQFSTRYNQDRPEDYSIRVEFSEGCSLQF